MFIEINDKYYNARFMSGLSQTTEEVDGSTKYVVVYSFVNGDTTKEYFDTQNEADSKFDEVKNTSAGGGGTTPSGTISITSNGTVDVTNYASANVNVEASSDLKTELISYLTSKSVTMLPITLTYDGVNLTFGSFASQLKGTTGSSMIIYYPDHLNGTEDYLLLKYWGTRFGRDYWFCYSLVDGSAQTCFYYDSDIQVYAESNVW